jgi:hypothetical protein
MLVDLPHEPWRPVQAPGADFDYFDDFIVSQIAEGTHSGFEVPFAVCGKDCIQARFLA